MLNPPLITKLLETSTYESKRAKIKYLFLINIYTYKNVDSYNLHICVLTNNRNSLYDRSLSYVFVNQNSQCSTVLETQSTGDRKSTRLNSSHANISYAVFCLKKKKKKKIKQKKKKNKNNKTKKKKNLKLREHGRPAKQE